MFRHQGKILNKVLWMNPDTNLRNTKRRSVHFWMCPWRWARDVCADPIDGLIHSWIRIWADYEEGVECGSMTLKTYFWGRCLALSLPCDWLPCSASRLLWYEQLSHTLPSTGGRNILEPQREVNRSVTCWLKHWDGWRGADSTSASWSHWQKWKLLSLSTARTEFRQLCITCWLTTHLSPFFKKKKSQINNDWKLKICSWPLNTSKSLQLSPGLLVCNSYVPWILQRFNLLPRKQKSPFNVWVLHGHNLIQLGKETEHRLYGEV